MRVLTWLALGLGVLWLANWAAGGRASEKALLDLDQRRVDAHATALGAGRPSAWKVQRLVVLRRIPLPGFSYYRGQSHVASGPISCGAPRSVVLWYGVGATVAWQDHEWFPGRQAVIDAEAKSGY